MALAKKPVNGMKDILPEEMQIRDHVIRVIKDTYRSFGFTPIETPCMENISNLSSKQGGENEKLIFKVLKRGEKLKLTEAVKEEDVVDFGMRYDLTLPLARFYANNANTLPSPFKALQVGPVWRADRPQKGRYRQFMQCDIDILGEASNLAEIELILATTATLANLGMKGFRIRINDRRILKAMADYSGFKKEDFDKVCIILDKMDKIGFDGVKGELLESGFLPSSVDSYLGMFERLLKMEGHSSPEAGVHLLSQELAAYFEAENFAARNLIEIIQCVEQAKTADFTLSFDPTLVRGMSYYTGTIFEIDIPQFKASCGGGGRYDRMIGNFTGKDVPACGFSIGFERIILLLLENNYKIEHSSPKKAYLLDKGLSMEKLGKIMSEAQQERQQGMQILVIRMNKNKKFQKEQLAAQGYEKIIELYSDEKRYE